MTHVHIDVHLYKDLECTYTTIEVDVHSSQINSHARAGWQLVSGYARRDAKKHLFWCAHGVDSMPECGRHHTRVTAGRTNRERYRANEADNVPKHLQKVNVLVVSCTYHRLRPLKAQTSVYVVTVWWAHGR